MTEIKIRFDLTFSRRFLSTGLSAVLMLGVVPGLESESVTLSTYYPAPSGVYTQMITTGNTFLARDGGNATKVGIGNSAPTYKLDVTGDIRANGWLRTDGAAGWYSESYGGGWYMSDGTWIRTYNSKNIWTGAGLLGGDGGLTVGYGGGSPPANGAIIAGNVGIGVNPPTRKLQVAGDIQGSGSLITPTACGAIASYSYGSSFGGTQALCPGQYVTSVEGVYVHRYNMPPSSSANGTYMCCPCPSGGCTL